MEKRGEERKGWYTLWDFFPFIEIFVFALNEIWNFKHLAQNNQKKKKLLDNFIQDSLSHQRFCLLITLVRLWEKTMCFKNVDLAIESKDRLEFEQLGTASREKHFKVLWFFIQLFLVWFWWISASIYYSISPFRLGGISSLSSLL